MKLLAHFHTVVTVEIKQSMINVTCQGSGVGVIRQAVWRDGLETIENIFKVEY